jgi:hypothetical protein
VPPGAAGRHRATQSPGPSRAPSDRSAASAIAPQRPIRNSRTRHRGRPGQPRPLGARGRGAAWH